MNKYLLLTSCSKRKRQLNNKPAIEVYDGPLFKAIRKHFDTTLPQVDIYILSSKYGLISSDTLINPYDQEMTPDQALEIQSDVTSCLAQIIKKEH